MKKLIVILVIAIVVAGAVFADETAAGSARIDITTCITPIEPHFRLAVTNTSADHAKYTLGDVYYSDVTTGTVVAGTASINDDALATTNTNVTVSFTINQTSDALTYKKYYFAVSATDLALESDANNSAYIDNLTAVEKTISVDNGTPSISPVTVAHVTPSDSAANKISQKYQGTRIVATETAQVPVGTFVVTWKGNTSAVPGTYKGNVTLTVTVE